MRYLTFLLLIFSSTLFSQSYLRVADPNEWGITNTNEDPNWHEYFGHGQFDSIALVIKPDGIYTQVEFFTSISQGDGWFWDNGEIVWQFRLPQQAIVHDSWLWVEDEIIKADVVDFWTASQIYEEIVDRNQDPSLLYQLPNGMHEIRIFPLPYGQNRRIKMSFLLPNTWTEDAVVTEILLPMLQSTYLHPELVEIIIPENEKWQNPFLVTNEGYQNFTNQTNSTYGPVHYLTIPGESLASLTEFNLHVDAPWSEDDTWLETYEDNGDKFYQLAIKANWEGYDTDTPPNPDTTERVLILIDRESSKTTFSKQELKANIQSYLLSLQEDVNSFNLMASTTNGIETYGDEWLLNNPSNLASVLGDYVSDTDSSDLELLLTEAFTLTTSADNNVKRIILFSANDSFVHPLVAQPMLDNVLPLLPLATPLDIYDFQNQNVSNVYYEGENHTGNSFAYNSLSQNTDGLLYEIRNSNQTLSEILDVPFVEIPDEVLGIIDLSVDLDNGVAFQEQNIFSSFFSENQSTVFYQTGRYLGEPSFEVEANLILNDGTFYSHEVEISNDETTEGDSLMREMWYGNFLREQASSASNEEQMLQIIQQSIDERVLIPQTAFLALEPGMGGTVCIPCLDNGNILILDTTDDEDSEEDKMTISIAPNPAQDVATITLTNVEKTDVIKVEIIDTKGIIITELNNPTESEWTWDIDDSVTSGLYLCKITLQEEILTEKIIVVRD